MELLIEKDNKVIEETLGLDKGTLVQEDDNYYRAEKDGDNRVGIHYRKHSQTEIVIESYRVGEDEYEICEWCGSLHPNTEMRKEVNLGYLCDGCQRAVESRGESLTYEE